MEKNKGIHLLYKKLSETPNETILRFKKENPQYADVPMTYAGRLDPMAEGLLLVLSGEKVNEKEKYLGLTKSYEFEILWGFETDTLDVLGLVQVFDSSEVKQEDIENVLEKSKGKFDQVYPVYSSRPVDGKSLFQWAREGRISEIDIPKHEVEIFDAEFISRRKISRGDLLKDITRNVSLVSGDFRQEQTVESWTAMLSNGIFDEFIIDKISIKVSGGFYVRQFVFDLAEKLNTKAVTFHIRRTKVGDFDVKDAI